MDGPTLENHLDRARSFELSPSEVEQVAEHLRTTDDDRARFRCIMILRRQGSRAHVPLIAPLVRSDNTGVADEAMRSLIRDAGRADLCHDTSLEWLGDADESASSSCMLSNSPVRPTSNCTTKGCYERSSGCSTTSTRSRSARQRRAR